MKSYTLDELMFDATPCAEWTRERCSAMMGDRETVTAVDVLTCADLTDIDAIYQAAKMMSPAQRAVAAWVHADEAQASADASAAAGAARAAGAAFAAAAADAAAAAAAASAASAANAAFAADAAAAAASDYDAAAARPMHVSREIFLAACSEMTT